MDGWKIVQLTSLAREEDVETLRHGYGKMSEYDESVGAVVSVRDLTPEDHEWFDEIIEDADE